MVKVLRSLAEQIAPEHTALVIIDPQKDFCDEDGDCARIFGRDVSRVQSAVKRLNPFIGNHLGKAAASNELLKIWGMTTGKR